MGVQSLGGEHPLEKEMAPIPVLLPGETPWIVECAVLQFIGSQVSDMIQPQNIYEVDSKELRYSPGNSTQYSIMTYVGMSGHTYN